MPVRNLKTAVFGIYSTREGAEDAMDALLHGGFAPGDISVLLPENLGKPTLVETATAATIYQPSDTDAYENPAELHSARITEIGTVKNTKAPEGATAGASTGAVIGGALGVLAGVGALAIPGIGPLLAAGPLVAALAGIGAGGVVGGFTGALIGMGIPEFEAKKYEGRIQRGGILLAVHCNTRGQVQRAREILAETGADDISKSGEESTVRRKTKGGAGANSRADADKTRSKRSDGKQIDIEQADLEHAERIVAEERFDRTGPESVDPEKLREHRADIHTERTRRGRAGNR